MSKVTSSVDLDLNKREKIWELAKKDTLLGLIAATFVTVLTNSFFAGSDNVDYFEKVEFTGWILVAVAAISALKNAGFRIMDDWIDERQSNRTVRETESNSSLFKQRVDAHFQMNSIAADQAIGSEIQKNIALGLVQYLDKDGDGVIDSNAIKMISDLMVTAQSAITKKTSKIKLPWGKFVDEYFKFNDNKSDPNVENIPMTDTERDIIKDLVSVSEVITVSDIDKSTQEVQDLNPTPAEANKEYPYGVDSNDVLNSDGTTNSGDNTLQS